MNRTGRVIIYVTGITSIIVLFLLSRLFDNNKFFVPIVIIGIIMLFSSITKGAERDKDKNDYRVSETLKRASQESESDTSENKVESEGRRMWNDIKPVRIENQSVIFNVDSINRVMLRENRYVNKSVIKLTEKAPVIQFCESGIITQEYCLQPENDEDFSDKYFKMTLTVLNEKDLLIVLCEGYISDSAVSGKINEGDKIIYRFEKHYLEKKTKNSAVNAFKKNDGKDLDSKALHFPGFVTKSNVRCVGICQKCNKSFAFRMYSNRSEFSEPVYSDDGLDVYELKEELSDNASVNKIWKVQGKTFSYYNSFCCPHCGGAYIDYKRHNSMKRFGNIACVHLGHKLYTD